MFAKEEAIQTARTLQRMPFHEDRVTAESKFLVNQKISFSAKAKATQTTVAQFLPNLNDTQVAIKVNILKMEEMDGSCTSLA